MWTLAGQRGESIRSPWQRIGMDGRTLHLGAGAVKPVKTFARRGTPSCFVGNVPNARRPRVCAYREGVRPEDHGRPRLRRQRLPRARRFARGSGAGADHRLSLVRMRTAAPNGPVTVGSREPSASPPRRSRCRPRAHDLVDRKRALAQALNRHVDRSPSCARDRGFPRLASTVARSPYARSAAESSSAPDGSARRRLAPLVPPR